MNDNRTMPGDPVMAAADPAMFAPLTNDETAILGAHLTSGWYKQSAVYPLLSEPWRETRVTLQDLHQACEARHQASQADRELEAGS